MGGVDQAEGILDKRKRMTNKHLTQLLGVQAMMVEGIRSFAEGWCTADGVVILRCVSVSLLVVVKEWEYKSIFDDIDEQTWEENVRGLERLLGGAVYQPGCLKGLTLLTLHHHVSKTGELKHAIPTNEQFGFVTVKDESSEVIWYLLTVVTRMPQEKESSCCDLNSAARVSRFSWRTCDAPDVKE